MSNPYIIHPINIDYSHIVREGDSEWTEIVASQDYIFHNCGDIIVRDFRAELIYLFEELSGLERNLNIVDAEIWDLLQMLDEERLESAIEKIETSLELLYIEEDKIYQQIKAAEQLIKEFTQISAVVSAKRLQLPRTEFLIIEIR